MVGRPLALLLLLSPATAHAGCSGALVASGIARPGPVTAEEVLTLRDFGPYGDMPGNGAAFALSPDGRFAALALRRADPDANSYCQGIVRVRVDDRSARLLDAGGEPLLMRFDFRGFAQQANGVVQSTPLAWSGDGRWIAYLRREHGVTQLWRVSAKGGDAAPLTSGVDDVLDFAWRGSDALVYRTRPGLRAAQADIASEGAGGYLYDRRFWPPGGSAPLPGSSAATATHVVRLTGDAASAASSDEEALLDPRGPGAPAGAQRIARGEGGRVAWTHFADPGSYFGATRLSISLNGREFGCDHAACGDGVIGIWWREDVLYFLRDWSVEDRGRTVLYRWKPGSGQPALLHADTGVLLDCALAQTGFLCAREEAGRPRHLVRIALEGGRQEPVYDPNPEWAARNPGQVIRLAVAARDGAPAFADLVLPPGHRPGERHPLVVVQHQSRGFLRGGTGDEVPVFALAARGLAVLSFQRPRQVAHGTRSASLREYQRVNVRGWADRARMTSALNAAIDQAVRTGAVDASRMALTGLSDGASAAQYALLADNRFRTAIFGTCCEGPVAATVSGGLALLDDVTAWGYPPPGAPDDSFWKPMSLAANAQRLEIPLLFQLSDREYQLALETIAALDAAGRPYEVRVFPDEYHVKYQPVHRLAMYRRSIDWLEFWLRGVEDADPARRPAYEHWRELRQKLPSSRRAAVVPDARPGLDIGQRQQANGISARNRVVAR